MVTVPIYCIRQANTKMIERKYLLNITKQQDSIIVLQKSYIDNQKIIIDDFQNRIITNTRINNNIQRDIKRKQKVINVLGGTTVVASVLLVLTIVLK